MTKRSSRKIRTKRRTKTMRLKGGNLNGNPPSSWGWGLGTLGNGWQQFTNALMLQPGQNLGTAQSNNIVPLNNINAQNSQGTIGPNMTGSIPQSGGRKRKSHCKRGGNVIAQAAVPLTLIAMNNAMGTKHRRHKHRRSNRRH